MTAAPIFIGGAGRSGTTLLRVMLDSHPNIACGRELKIVPLMVTQWEMACRAFPDQSTNDDPFAQGADHIDTIYRDLILGLLAMSQWGNGDGRKPRVAEKTPHNVLVFEGLHRLFPEAALIHIVRDARDVVASLLAQTWTSPQTGESPPYTRNAEAAARYWVEIVEGAEFPPKAPHILIHYEALVTEPEKNMRALLAAIHEPWHDSVLRHSEFNHDIAPGPNVAQVRRPIYLDSVGRWKTDLSPADLDTVLGITGSTMEKIGYMPRDEAA